MIDMTRVERALTQLSEDEFTAPLVVEEYFANGPTAAFALVEAQLVRRGLARPAAKTGAACVLVGIGLVMAHVRKRKAGADR